MAIVVRREIRETATGGDLGEVRAWLERRTVETGRNGSLVGVDGPDAAVLSEPEPGADRTDPTYPLGAKVVDRVVFSAAVKYAMNVAPSGGGHADPD